MKIKNGCDNNEEDPYDCCDDFRSEWGTLHKAGKMAAANGTPIHVKAISYCPWCGAEKSEPDNTKGSDSFFGQNLRAAKKVIKDYFSYSKKHKKRRKCGAGKSFFR
jgi:hypothetical protein